MSSKWWLVAAASGVLALGVAACGGDDEDSDSTSSGGGGEVSGTINIDGSSTVFPFAQRAAELFNEENPDVSINVGQSGTGGGFEKFCAGETDISDASRPIEAEEIAICEKNGIAYEELQVASDGIAVVTNPAQEVSCLSTDQLKQLWNKGSTVANLSELGQDADSGEALPDAELSLAGPGTDSGTFDFFTETVNGEEGVSREDYQPSEDDNVIVQTVSGDEGGLGYFGFSYYEQNADALNLVSVDAGEGCVAPSIETIQDESYVLSRPLFMYPSDAAAQKPEVLAFLQYIEDNYEVIATDALIVPMPAEAAEESATKLDAISGGGSGGTETLLLSSATHPVSGATPRGKPLGVRRPRRGEDAIRYGLFAAAAISVLTTIGILYALLSETIKFFGDVGITRFITDGDWTPTFADPQYGVWPLVNGTLLITGIAILIAVPLGLGSAIYLAEYATPRIRKIIKPILEVLVGVPTVVFGFFALSFVTPAVLQDGLGLGVSTQNALAAGLVVGIMILPTIASISEDAMAAVPQGLREGAYGLGASRMQVSLRVVVPAALSGIVAAIVLGVSRGIGETMIVLIAAGLQPNTGANLLEGFETMTTFIAATGQGDIPTGSTEYKTIFAVGTILFFMTLAMNMIAIRFVRKYRQVYD